MHLFVSVARFLFVSTKNSTFSWPHEEDSKVQLINSSKRKQNIETKLQLVISPE